jgi:hypothetical protein
MLLQRPDRRYVALHSHTNRSSFSDADVANLLQFLTWDTTIVIDQEGTWYLLSRSREPVEPSPGHAIVRYRRQAAALKPKYDALVASRRMSRVTAWREGSHEIMELIAPPLGLRYERMVVI